MSLYVIGGLLLAGLLLVVRQVLLANRVEAIMSKLHPLADQVKQDRYQEELGRLNQEIKDAKIQYDVARRNPPVLPPNSGN